MKSESLKIIKKRKRLKLTFMQVLGHYRAVVLIMLVPAYIVWDILKKYATNPAVKFDYVSDMLSTFLIFSLVGLIVFVYKYQQLAFKEFRLVYNEEQFQEAVERTVNELDWQVAENDLAFFIAFGPWRWNSGDGEMITILKDQNRLLINSLSDTGNSDFLFSYGWNRKNLNTFLKNLEDVIDNKPAIFKIVVKENEWGLKRILIRVLMYPICALLLVVGIFMMKESQNIFVILTSLTILAFVFVYLFTDIKLIVSNIKKKEKA